MLVFVLNFVVAAEFAEFGVVVIWVCLNSNLQQSCLHCLERKVEIHCHPHFGEIVVVVEEQSRILSLLLKVIEYDNYLSRLKKKNYEE